MKWIAITAAVLAAVYFVLVKFESLKGKSLELTQMLVPGGNYLFYRIAILELRRRGEDESQYAALFPPLLASDDKTVRYRGWHIFRELYPKLAEGVSYEPLGDL